MSATASASIDLHAVWWAIGPQLKMSSAKLFLDVPRKAGTFAGRSQVSSWLLAITRNKAIQAMRRRSLQPLDDAASEMLVDGADTPEAALEKKQVSSMSREALKHLSQAHRELTT